MKKIKSNFGELKLNKINISSLNFVKGGNDQEMEAPTDSVNTLFTNIAECCRISAPKTGICC